jgi:hypothetical protein
MAIDIVPEKRSISVHGVVLLATCLGTGSAACIDDDGGVSEPHGIATTSSSEQPLYVLSTSVWHGPIPVCWENAAAGNATERGWVQHAAESSWQAVANLDFTGWGDCPASGGGVRIRIDDSGPHTKGLGTALDGVAAGMVLNFTFANWSPGCQNQREYCIRAIAVHEFGHALGFAHEQNRPDTPSWCNQEQGTDGDTTIGAWDLDSVMNYCNPHWNGDGNLSATDISAARQVYGPISDDWGYSDRQWMVDFNGDGKADYCRAVGTSSGGPNSYLRCSLSSGSGFSGEVFSPIDDWGYSDRRWMADFNGDGKADYCRAVGTSSGAGSYLRCSLSSGSGFSGDTWPLVDDWGYSGRRWMADFNGDGKADYCRAVGTSSGGANSYLRCSLSSGSGFSSNTWPLVDDWGHSDRRWMVDFNGDGKADYCRAVGESEGYGSYLRCSLSSGSGFSSDTWPRISDWANSDRRWMADFNGDLKAEFCRAIANRLACGTPSP